jgi:hypothetical protein
LILGARDIIIIVICRHKILVEKAPSIEEILENYALVQLIKENEGEETSLNLKEARAYYQTLEKAP